MSMAFPLWSLLYLLIIPLTWAGPLSTVSLTPALRQAVPICAQSCVDSFIKKNFPYTTCGTPANFRCLCTSDSTSGFTVGEGALQCLYASCGDVNESQAVSVYSVCIPIPNAKPNTYGTLTATISSAIPSTKVTIATQPTSSKHFTTSTLCSFKSSSASPTAPSSTYSISTAITSASSSSSRSSSATVESSQSTSPPAGGIISAITTGRSSASSTASAAAASASSPAPVLTKPQIAGVVVAGVGAAAIGFGLCFLFVYLRRRKNLERRHSGSSFGGDKILPSEETTPDMAAIAARDFEHERQTRQQYPSRQYRSPTSQLRLETPASSSEDDWSQYQRYLAPQQTGLAPGSQVPRPLRDQHSPITPASNRTRNSQLLPDKPTYSLFPPSRVTPRNSIPNQVIKPRGNSPKPAVPPLGSPFTRPAPQHPRSVDTSQAHLQDDGAARAPNFSDAPSRSPPKNYPFFRQPRSQLPPTSTLPRPRTFRIPSWEQPPSAGVVRKPLPTYRLYRGQGVDPVPIPNVPGYSYRRKSSRKKSIASRPETIFSNGSETSFEGSDDEDDETQDPRSALLPVAELPTAPIGRVSYPDVPVSAAESPTRRPRKTIENPAPPDSLLSKRLGEKKAREIAGRLRSPARQSGEDNAPRSAKWRISANPGLRGIDKSASPPSTKNAVRSPPTPWRR